MSSSEYGHTLRDDPDYVAIIVHRDVLADAMAVIGAIYIPIEALAILRDLTDPLPEPDVNNVTPRILYLTRDEADNLSENRWRIGTDTLPQAIAGESVPEFPEDEPDGWTYANREAFDPPRR